MVGRLGISPLPIFGPSPTVRHSVVWRERRTEAALFPFSLCRDRIGSSVAGDREVPAARGTPDSRRRHYVPAE
jgi:hypothetical protein